MSHLGRILTASCLLMLMAKIKGEVDVEVMGLAEDAFDDQYIGCREAMERRLEEQNTLQVELLNSKEFSAAWQEGEKIWNSKMENWNGHRLPEGFGDRHGIALVTYTGFIREKFNRAVKSAGRSHGAYVDDFHFKFLHYYLTVALQLLYKDCKGDIQKTYRGFDDVLLQLPKGTTKVKFGHFLHTSYSEAVAYDMGNASFLTVFGCSGVPVDKFSDYPQEEEVIFPGYEIFNAKQVQEDPRKILLVSTGQWCSNFNCALIRGESSRLAVKDCNSSGDGVLSDREVWLHNMTEGIFSAAPAASLLRSASLITSLVAAALVVIM